MELSHFTKFILKLLKKIAPNYLQVNTDNRKKLIDKICSTMFIKENI